MLMYKIVHGFLHFPPNIFVKNRVGRTSNTLFVPPSLSTYKLLFELLCSTNCSTLEQITSFRCTNFYLFIYIRMHTLNMAMAGVSMTLLSSTHIRKLRPSSEGD